MMTSNTVTVSHFSDVLCIWAYIAQIRIDELKAEFGSHVDMQYHFLPVFGSVSTMLDKNWKARGGVTAYNKHVLSIAEKFDHIEVNDGIWSVNTPTTSVSSHLFLKAIQLVDSQHPLPAREDNMTALERYAWELRLAFFRDLKDISNTSVQLEIARRLQYPVDQILEKIANGEAYAALEIDAQLREEYQVSGSPTLIFNEGRQKIYGNVGYRVIQANIRELINNPGNQLSWC